MSKWTAASSDDYYEALERLRRPLTGKCANCGNPVDLDESDTYRVKRDILCRHCKAER